MGSTNAGSQYGGAAGVDEVSVDVTASAQRHGVGRERIARLISASESEGYWTLQAHMMASNAASAALHPAYGLGQVGYGERYGQLTVSGTTSFCWNGAAGRRCGSADENLRVIRYTMLRVNNALPWRSRHDDPC